MNHNTPAVPDIALADGGLDAYTCEALVQDGVLTTLRGTHAATSHTILITTAASQRQSADAVHYLNNEYALRAHLDASWARPPHGMAWHNGALALLYPDLDDRPLARSAPAVGHIEAFLRLALSLCSAVRAMHNAGIVHQNLTPATVMLDSVGNCRLVGFGVASAPAIGVRPAARSAVRGRSPYISPEQTGRSQWSNDRRSDLYALGVMLHELLTGQLPFPAAYPSNAVEWLHAPLAADPPVPQRDASAIPAVLSALVLKLLAKHPNERYQSAAALETDLKHCRHAWQRHGRIDDFALGLDDAPALRFSDRLFGRADAMQALLEVYQSVAEQGKSALALVHGAAGQGKTALLAQFLRHPALQAASVASAKIDQFGGEATHIALSEALRGLVICILGQSRTELDFWRARIRHALEGDAAMLRGLAFKLVPELALLAGMPAARAAAAEAEPESLEQQRLTILRLLEIFVARGRPLLLTIDDVQWLDGSMAALLADLVSQLESLPIMLLVTSPSSADGKALPPITERLLRHPRANEIALAALAPPTLAALLAEALSSDLAEVAELTQVVHRKTAGNPYFVQQFMQSMVDQRLAWREGNSGVWHFALEKIAALGVTDNVAELTLAHLAWLPAPTQHTLRILACLGRVNGAGLLSELQGASAAELDRDLALAVAAGIVTPSPAGYLFSHDRLQQAAYAELDSASRDALHVRLGLLMIDNGMIDQRDELLFSAMDHLQKAPQLLLPQQRQPIATVALLAARKARHASAYAPALSYLNLAQDVACFAAAPWTQLLCFEAELERAYCHCFGGDLAAALAMLPALRSGPQARQLQGQVLRLAAEVALRQGDYAQAVRHTLDGLRRFDIDLPEHPDDAQCERAYAALRSRLQGDWRATLHALPPLDSADMAVAMSLLSGLFLPASFTSASLLFLHLCQTLELSLEHGICGETSMALAWLGVTMGARYGAYSDGFAYADAARSLVEQRGFHAHAAPVLLALDQVSVWTQPLSSVLQYAKAGYDAALVAGDLTIANLEHCHRICMLITRGDPLDAVAAEIAQARILAGKIAFRDMDKILQVQQRFVNHLRGVAEPAPLVDSIDADTMVTIRFWYLVYQAIHAFLDEDNPLALTCLDQAGVLAWSAPAHIHQMEYHLFSVLVLAASSTPATAQAGDAERIDGHLALLAQWADLNPATFADKYAMAMAAVRERDGDTLAALALYEQAIAHAQAQDFHHYTAMAHELASRLSRRQGLATAAQSHLRGAIDAYRRWGALRRAEQLAARDSHHASAASNAPHPAANTPHENAEVRDVDRVIRATIALSQEIDGAELVRSLMAIALEHASAERGLLIRIDDDTPRLGAHAVLTAHGVEVTLAHSVPDAQDLPLTMLNMALRTLNPVSVGAAPRQAPFQGDPYLQQYAQCSAICIPMLKQARLVGLLYLENRNASSAFTGEQARALSLLAAQAAVSLETADLYAEVLQENLHRREMEKALRESRAMLLQGERMNRCGSFSWHVADATINCTPELCRVFGLSNPQPTMPLTIFVEALHEDDQPRVKRILEHVIEHRCAYAMDYRVVDPDGKIRHLSCAGEPMAGTEGLVFIGTTVDITERRAAEDSLRQAHVELARASRVTTVGQLTSSIAHEINQPLMSIVSNAGASLRWLDRDPPQLDRVRSGLQDIAEQSQRVGDIIRGLRALTRKGSQESAPIDVHATIHHIVLISRAEFERNEVKLELALNAHSGWIEGDTVQLQQVLLNVVVNALDAMAGVTGRPRVLLITTSSHQQQLVVRVDDTGSGLTPDSASRMFDPYYTTKHEGMGMGLAICRSIIEAHAGSITAEPRQPYGCSMILRLPEKA